MMGNVTVACEKLEQEQALLNEYLGNCRARQTQLAAEMENAKQREQKLRLQLDGVTRALAQLESAR
jgi:hypothetical protein